MTFLNDSAGEAEPYPDGSRRARVRVRRCPGFELLAETFAYHNRQGGTYHVAVRKAGGRIDVAIDGAHVLSATDAREPLTGGLLGLRTYQTFLWWDNISVTALD